MATARSAVPAQRSHSRGHVTVSPSIARATPPFMGHHPASPNKIRTVELGHGDTFSGEPEAAEMDLI